MASSKADTIFRGGTIITMDDARRQVQALGTFKEGKSVYKRK